LGRWGGNPDEPKLLEHQQPSEHQVERDVLAVAQAEQVDVVQAERAVGWWDVARRGIADP